MLIRVFLICFIISSASAQEAGTIHLPQDLVDSDTEVEGVRLDMGFCEGPAVDPNGNIFFSEWPGDANGKIWKVTPEHEITVFRSPSNGANGLAFDTAGRLVACEKGKVTRTEHNGEITILAEDAELGDVNDLYVGANGAMYFANGWGGKVWYYSPEGEVMEMRLVQCPNGIEWIEEDSVLYLVAYQALDQDGALMKYRVEEDGSLTQPETVAPIHFGDGCTVDELGNIWVASAEEGAVYVINPEGEKLGSIEFDEKHITNCAFGGPEGNILYITGQGGLRSVQLKVAGRNTVEEEPTFLIKSGFRGTSEETMGYSILISNIKGKILGSRHQQSMVSGGSVLLQDQINSYGQTIPGGKYYVTLYRGSQIMATGCKTILK
jgi:gluconolactonase